MVTDFLHLCSSERFNSSCNTSFCWEKPFRRKLPGSQTPFLCSETPTRRKVPVGSKVHTMRSNHRPYILDSPLPIRIKDKGFSCAQTPWLKLFTAHLKTQLICQEPCSFPRTKWPIGRHLIALTSAIQESNSFLKATIRNKSHVPLALGNHRITDSLRLEKTFEII